MYLLLMFMPLLGATLAGLLGRKLGTRGAQVITCICMATSALLSATAFYEVALCNSSVTVMLPSWLDTGLLTVH
jgi:NADH:ubiquinone oxidoreductase subunit 5 (subunit L)/multisubunit Na+/H+ antiporter MnhA subunit